MRASPNKNRKKLWKMILSYPPSNVPGSTNSRLSVCLVPMSFFIPLYPTVTCRGPALQHLPASLPMRLVLWHCATPHQWLLAGGSVLFWWGMGRGTNSPPKTLQDFCKLGKSLNPRMWTLTELVHPNLNTQICRRTHVRACTSANIPETRKILSIRSAFTY